MPAKVAVPGPLGRKELKTLSSILKRVAKVADEADNFAVRAEPAWSAALFEAQSFQLKLATEFKVSQRERAVVDAIQNCCNTIIKRFRVERLHEREPDLPQIRQWYKEKLQPVRLSDLRRVCIAYELKNGGEPVRPMPQFASLERFAAVRRGCFRPELYFVFCRSDR